MDHRMFRLGWAAAVGAIVAAMMAAVWSLDATAATVKPDKCPTDKPLVVDSFITFENDADFGPAGPWALDAGTFSIRIWRLGGDAYCLQEHEVGTFVTFGGLSPEGTGTVRSGVVGSIDGTYTDRLYGRFAPTVPTTGFLGNLDRRCGEDGTCLTPVFSVRQSYFPSGYQHVDGGALDFTRAGGACGTWHQTSSGDTGDIVC